MKHISPTQLFKEQVEHIGEKRAAAVLDNFIPVERTIKYALCHNNVSSLSMVVKVKNSSYSVKYTYNKRAKELLAVKLLG